MSARFTYARCDQVDAGTIASMALRVAHGIEGGSPVQVMVWVAAQDAPPLETLVAELRSALGTTSFFGGVFPALIDGAQLCERGALVVAFVGAVPVCLVRGLERPDVALPRDMGAREGQTAIVLVDGLARSIGPFLDSLYDQLGATVRYWGGGAGWPDLSREPCLFTAEGPVRDAALVAFVPEAGRVGARHGWRELEGLLVATRTRGHELVELNWEPAAKVYRETVERDCGEAVDVESFASLAAGYPFGIQSDRREPVVRDPIAITEEGSLVCVGDVPENAVLAILKGEADALIAAASDAATIASGGSDTAALALVADCVSRRGFLRGRFDEELDALQSGVARRGRLLGVLTLGEIGSQGDAHLDFYNKTSVVVSLDGLATCLT